jgi:putative tryptophan/tyrosine transport system substrate-binding protein
MMRRRELITLLGGAAAAWPLAARAQQAARVRQVGVLMAFAETDTGWQARVAAFREQLHKLGWANGGNLRIAERWAGDDMDRVRAYAAQLVDLNPDAILVAGVRAVAVLQERTKTIPLVATGISEPVETRLATSFSRPGNNLTGFTLFEFSMMGKSLELLKQMAPGITRAAIVFNPDQPTTIFYSRPFESAAAALGLQPVVMAVRQPADIEHEISAFAREPNGGLYFPPDVTLSRHRELVIALTARLRLPAIYSDSILVSAGGLVSYGPDRMDIYRRAATYIDRILRGEKPGDLPIQQPTKYELTINRKTATALGLTVPNTLLVAADEVIE